MFTRKDYFDVAHMMNMRRREIRMLDVSARQLKQLLKCHDDTVHSLVVAFRWNNQAFKENLFLEKCGTYDGNNPIYEFETVCADEEEN